MIRSVCDTVTGINRRVACYHTAVYHSLSWVQGECQTIEFPPCLLQNGHDEFGYGACFYGECFYGVCFALCEAAYLLGGFLFWLGRSITGTLA